MPHSPTTAGASMGDDTKEKSEEEVRRSEGEKSKGKAYADTRLPGSETYACPKGALYVYSSTNSTPHVPSKYSRCDLESDRKIRNRGTRARSRTATMVDLECYARVESSGPNNLRSK